MWDMATTNNYKHVINNTVLPKGVDMRFEEKVWVEKVSWAAPLCYSLEEVRISYILP